VRKKKLQQYRIANLTPLRLKKGGLAETVLKKKGKEGRKRGRRKVRKGECARDHFLGEKRR